MASFVRAAVRPIRLSRELKAFCDRLGITKYVPVVVRIVRESFRHTKKIELESECDPESGEEWLVIRAQVSGTRIQVRQGYEQYTRTKIQVIPWPQGGKIALFHYT